MSHSTVLVLTKTADDLESALAPFDENTEVPRYIANTKAQLIATERQRHTLAAENLAEMLNDPQAYWPRGIQNPAHLRWIVRDAPAAAALSDDELWEQVVKPKAYDLDDEGNQWSTYNPRSRWDWYAIGGRWDRELVVKGGGQGNVNQARLGDLNLLLSLVPFAVLTPDGTWHEQGKMRWFGIVQDEDDAWEKKYRELIAQQDPDLVATLVDVHI